MKRNFILFGILASLLIFTYFFEEIGGKRKKIEFENQNKLFNAEKLGDILSFENLSGKIFFKDNQFFTSKYNYPVDPNVLSSFFNILSKIKIRRYLSPSEISKASYKLFIPNKKTKMIFEFERGRLVFILGKRMQIDTSFYMEIKTEASTNIVLAYDDSPSRGIYMKKNAHLNTAKYDRLKRLFYLDEESFYNKKVFKNMPASTFVETLKMVKVENLRNKGFEVNFKNSQTDPPIYDMLNPNIGYYQLFLTASQRMEGMYIFHPAKYKELKQQIASITYGGNDQKVLTLYRKYEKKNGYFIKTNFDKTIYEIDQDRARIFFSNVQDFWEKRVIGTDVLKKEAEYKFSLIFEKSYPLIMKTGETFEMLSENENIQPKNSSFKELFVFLAREADYVKKGKASKIKKLFSFRFQDSMFHVIFNSGDLILFDEKKGLEFHYYVGDLSRFKYKKSDYLND